MKNGDEQNIQTEIQYGAGNKYNKRSRRIAYRFEYHVEGVVHVVLGDIAGLLEELEDSRNLVAVLADLCSNAVRKRAWNVLVEAAAGDVADGVDCLLYTSDAADD